MTEAGRRIVELFLWACAKLDAADRITWADANAIAMLAAQIKFIVREGRDPEELALQNLVHRTEELITSLALHESDASAEVKGDVFGDVVEWRMALAELAEVRAG